MRRKIRLGRFELLEARILATSLSVPAGISALPGEMVSVPVQVDDADGILNADLQIQFHTSALDTSDNSIHPGLLWPPSAISEATVIDETGVDGSGHAIGLVSATVFAAEPLAAGGGTLLTIDFTIPEDAPSGDCYDVDFASASLNEGTIAATTNGGSVCIPNNLRPEIVDQLFSVPENSPQDTVVGRVVATDPDLPAQSLSYSIVDGNPSGTLAIDGQSGQIRVNDPTGLDHEGDGNPIELTVEVMDNATPPAANQATITVDITDVNEPPMELDLSGHSVPENSPGAVLGAVTVSDPDAGDSHTLDVSDDRFEIIDNQLKLKPEVSLDYESGPQVTLDITATDSGGLSASQTFTVDVADVNEAPTDIQLDASPVVENHAGATVGGVTVTDPDAGDQHTLSTSDERFEIVDGQLKLKGDVPLDYETETSVTLGVTATDSGGLSRTEFFEISVVDIAEATSVISGTVYADANGNQAIDPLEAVPRVKITLSGEGVTASEWTDDQGRYEFRDLQPGEYAIAERQPAAYLAGGPDQQTVSISADSNVTDINFLERGLKPEFLYSRLFATPNFGNPQVWQALIRAIIVEAELAAGNADVLAPAGGA